MGCPVEARRLRVEAGGRAILEVGELSLGPGGLHGVIGPNGSGKTTLLRVLAGVAGHRGEARVCGRSPRQARALTGYMPQSPLVDPLATARDVVAAGLYGAPRQGAEWASRLVGVEGLLDRRFASLSGGEQRLVCLARALARRPRLLLLDEPLSGLDIRNAVRVLRLLRSLSRGSTIVASAHELHYIGAFDTVTLLSRGRPLYHGPPGGLEPGLLEEAYGVPVEAAVVGGVRVFLPADPVLRGEWRGGDLQP